MTRIGILFVLLLQLQWNGIQYHSVYANYLSTPELKWRMPIVANDGNGQNNNNNALLFQKGNAIVPINNKGLLAITSSTGALHIVTTPSSSSSSNGNELEIDNTTGIVVDTTGLIKTYVPSMMNEDLDTVTCQGGIISIVQLGTTPIVVYAVTGTDSTNQNRPMSRIIAINTTSATLVWNTTIPGTIVGTPILSTDTNFMYIIHNVVTDGSTDQQQQPGMGTESIVGQITILKYDASSNIFSNSGSSSTPPRPTYITTLPASSSTPNTLPALAPASITTHPTTGKEYLFFADGSTDNTYSATFANSLYAVTLSATNSNKFDLFVVTTQISSTNTAPTYLLNTNDNTVELFLGQPESIVFGWTNDAAIALWDKILNNDGGNTSTGSFVTPTWQIETSQSRDDSSAPVPSSPITSSNGTILYVTSAGVQILALNLESRQAAWASVDLDSSVLSKPVYDHQQLPSGSINATLPVIYFMENDGGILRQYNAITGDLNWLSDCNIPLNSSNPDDNNRDENCAIVVADFTVQNNMLYYIDVIGNLIALKVADFIIETPPTIRPTPAPTVPTSEAPAEAPIETPIEAPAAAPSTTDTVPPTMAPISQQTNTPPSIIRTNIPTTAPKNDEEESNEEKSVQTWLSSNIMIVAISASCVALLLLLLFFSCFRRSKYNKKSNKNIRKTFQQGSQIDEVDGDMTGKSFQNTTIIPLVVSPKQSIDGGDNDKSFENLNITASTSPNQSMIEGDNDKSFENFVPITSVATPLRAINEGENEEEHRSQADIENNIQQTNVETEPEKVVQNLLERFAMTSFDMEEDENCHQLQKIEGGVLSKDSLTVSEQAMLDTYSLASKKEIDDAASLSGTLSIASKGSNRSKGSTHSLKDSLLSVIGFAARTEIGKESGSIKSLTSDKSQQKSAPDIIQRFEATDSQAATPNLDYPEPGAIRPGHVDATSPLFISPANSYDESLYMDESTIASLEMQASVAKLPDDALAGTNEIGKLPSDCPEDEVTNKLQPGLVYLNRHIEKKREPVRATILDDSKRIQPMYNGVSVRPASRSRAGIFSRRQPKATAHDNDDDEDNAATGVPERTPEPLAMRSRRNLVPPASPIIDSQLTPSDNSEPRTPPVRFTAAGYYVEEAEPDDSLLHDESTVDEESQTSSEVGKRTKASNAGNQVSKKIDTWNSFLNELSKVENQFFNPTTKSKRSRSLKHDRIKTDLLLPKTSQSLTAQSNQLAAPRPPPDVANDSESDEEEILPPPPPAPRTFYA